VNADIVSSGAMNTTMPIMYMMTTKREDFIIFFVPPSRRINLNLRFNTSIRTFGLICQPSFLLLWTLEGDFGGLK
jgi:hypothetical protein